MGWECVVRHGPRQGHLRLSAIRQDKACCLAFTGECFAQTGRRCMVQRTHTPKDKGKGSVWV